MNSSTHDHPTLPGLPTPAPAVVRAGSPITLPPNPMFSVPASQAIAGVLSDALVVAGPSFNGGDLAYRALCALRFIACNLDVICQDDPSLAADMQIITDRIDVFLGHN